MSGAFPNCRRLGSTPRDFFRADAAIPSAPHAEQLPFIKASNAEWRQWRSLDLLLASGIPEPVL